MFRKRDKTDKGNCREFTLLKIRGKAFGKLLKDRIIGVLERKWDQ